ncbi:MAG: flagellar biosynthesis protein FlhB [Betaproteobacteria bacterium RBG_16_58_11]|nr:MAG: flagellar biosynthesis protein FlhB [Betaproteobacteria bacterium RBG_16_58_11]OGA00361.1 MAG: flagellar biosynthesis protein FlhB [Betaproteobacteria bacterium RBG_19FT_COMBO_58_11]
MADDSDLEKTEAATGRRIQRAREDGKVVQSKELAIFIQLMAAVAGLMLMGSYIMEKLISIMRHGFTLDRATIFDSTLMMSRFMHDTSDALIAFLPLMLLFVLAAFAGPLLMGGWNFTWKPLTPDLTKFNPIAGMKRMVSLNGLMELMKASVKAALVGSIGAWVIWRYKDELFALAGESLGAGMAHMGDLLFTTAFFMIGSLILLVLADVPFQLWHYAKGLRMTKEEVKQEAKETEGDPQIKARIRSAQRAAARKRMMSAVPKADVIVTNPTHYAVALKYEEGQMAAPQIVAKGMGLLAERIMELGQEHAVPVLQAPPLARALYRHADVGDTVPERLYTAVAEVLAYVYQLRNPEYAVKRPIKPEHLPVPVDMDMPEVAGEAV